MHAQQTVSEALYVAIGRTTDPQLRGLLMRVRRDLFNRRLPKPSLLKLAMEGPSGVAVASATAAISAVTAARMECVAAFDAAREEGRDKMIAALSSRRLVDGILLSSPALFGNIERYRRAPRQKPNARQLHIERGLLRYLTRTAMKATPFASFCSIIGADCVPANGGDIVRFSGALEPRTSAVRLNKALYAALWAHLKTRPAVRRLTGARLNPTIFADAGEYVFLAGFGRREVFQRIARTPAVELAISVVRETQSLTLGALAQRLVDSDRLDGATVDDATAFVDTLTGLGLFQLRAPVATQEADWPNRLADSLRGVVDDHAVTIGAFAGAITDVAAEYARADTSQRSLLDQRLRGSVAAITAQLGAAVAWGGALALYEDCGATATLKIASTSGLSTALSAMRRLVQRLRPLAAPRAEMAAMRHFFESHYSAMTNVPLLTFYEDYYREHFKAHLERRKQRERGVGDGSTGYDVGNPFKLLAVHAIREAADAWPRAILEAWRRTPNAEEIAISERDVGYPRGLPPAPASTPLSVASFCQLAPGNKSADDVRMVVRFGRMFLGHGKFFSRFMHVLDPGVEREVVRRNACHGPEMIIAEIAADSDFNGNLHPRLLECEIAYPTVDANEAVPTVHCTDLEVQVDPMDAIGLMLVDRRRGKRVLPIDLGFLSLRNRPPLYQLLTNFAPFIAADVAIPPTMGIVPLGDAIGYRPRIVYDESIVLARRQWRVPRPAVPSRLPSEADADFFLRLNEWRVVAGIPIEAFVRVIPRAPIRSDGPRALRTAPEHRDLRPRGAPDPVASVASAHAGEPNLDATAARPGSKPSGQSNIRASRDFVKPQYVDFSSPALVALFERLPSTLADYLLEIEERYPGDEALPEADGGRHAYELVVQFDGEEVA